MQPLLVFASGVRHPVDVLAPRVGEYDAIVSLGCGAGVQALAERFPRTHIYPGLNTQFIGILESQGVDPEDVKSIGILAFIKNARRGRRVESVYVPGPGGHRVRWLRDEIEDIFLADGPDPVPAERADELAEVFESLADRGVNSFADVRRELAAVLRPAGGEGE